MAEAERDMTELLSALSATVTAARERGAISDAEWNAHFRDKLPDPRPYRASQRGELPIYLHMRDGATRTISFDCNAESPFQALERVYRGRDMDEPEFMVSDVERITFSGT